jgi:hypothetical protein
MNIRARVQIAKGKLREYEGRLKQLEGRLTVLRGRTQQTTGRARLRLLRVERGLRGTLDGSVQRVESAIKALELRLKSALRETQAFQRGVRAGMRSGANTYHRLRRK